MSRAMKAINVKKYKAENTLPFRRVFLHPSCRCHQRYPISLAAEQNPQRESARLNTVVHKLDHLIGFVECIVITWWISTWTRTMFDYPATSPPPFSTPDFEAFGNEMHPARGYHGGIMRCNLHAVTDSRRIETNFCTKPLFSLFTKRLYWT